MKLAELKNIFVKLKNNLAEDYEVRPDNVYRKGSDENREIIGQMAEDYLLPGSRLENAEALATLRHRSLHGESCLLLAEHYSNCDYPILYRFVEKHPRLGDNTASSLLPMRGVKLSEFDPLTAAFTNSYDNIVIYPSRALNGISDPKKLSEVRKFSTLINHAAMRELVVRKHAGRIITVFPSGTRYRPWAPDSKKGVREIHSYLKIFDWVVFMAVNGNILLPHEYDDMTQDELRQDLVILTISDPVRSRDFRRRAMNEAPENKDPKTHVVDKVMSELQRMHDAIEPMRLKEKIALEPSSGANTWSRV